MTMIRMKTCLPVQVDSTSLADLKAELYRKKGEAERNKQKGNYRPEKVGHNLNIGYCTFVNFTLYTEHCTTLHCTQRTAHWTLHTLYHSLAIYTEVTFVSVTLVEAGPSGGGPAVV